MMRASSIEEALACAAIFGRVLDVASKTYALETADLIACEWRGFPVAHALRIEAARAIVTQMDERDVDPVLVAMTVLRHRAETLRHLYGWPVIDADTVDAMAVRAAKVWRAREGE